MEPSVDEAIRRAEAALSGIESEPAAPTFENTLKKIGLTTDGVRTTPLSGRRMRVIMRRVVVLPEPLGPMNP